MTGETGKEEEEEEEEYPAASCGCRGGHMRQRESVIRERLIEIESMKMCFFFYHVRIVNENIHA